MLASTIMPLSALTQRRCRTAPQAAAPASAAAKRSSRLKCKDQAAQDLAIAAATLLGAGNSTADDGRSPAPARKGRAAGDHAGAFRQLSFPGSLAGFTLLSSRTPTALSSACDVVLPAFGVPRLRVQPAGRVTTRTVGAHPLRRFCLLRRR